MRTRGRANIFADCLDGREHPIDNADALPDSMRRVGEDGISSGDVRSLEGAAGFGQCWSCGDWSWNYVVKGCGNRSCHRFMRAAREGPATRMAAKGNRAKRMAEKAGTKMDGKV